MAGKGRGRPCRRSASGDKLFTFLQFAEEKLVQPAQTVAVTVDQHILVRYGIPALFECEVMAVQHVLGHGETHMYEFDILVSMSNWLPLSKT